jgi:tRNA dimethylallyltransferase
VGYPQVLSFLAGEISREEALAQLIIKTRQYAKRQRTWFNRYTGAQRICLGAPSDFDPEKITQAVLACVQ